MNNKDLDEIYQMKRYRDWKKKVDIVMLWCMIMLVMLLFRGNCGNCPESEATPKTVVEQTTN